VKKTISLLGALLAAQLLLAFGLAFTGPRLSAKTADRPLFTLGGKSIDRITIEGPDKAKVVLAKAGDAWQLPDEGNFPADKARAGTLVRTLEGLKEGAPVATTSDALARFKVGADRYERRVTLAAGSKTLATLYFGTSPSMREIHARRSGQRDVYSVAFASYQVPAKADEWEDKAVLQLPKQDIASIDVAGLHILRTPGPTPRATALAAASPAAPTPAAKAASAMPGSTASPAKAPVEAARPEWEANGLPKGESLSTEAADKLAGLIANLRIGSVLGKDAPADAGLDKPELEISLVKSGGAKVDYALGKSKDGKRYTLGTSARPEYFSLPGYVAEPLVDAAKRDRLLIGPSATHHPSAAPEPAAKLGKPAARG
jgi:hypothetical protein